MKIEMGESLFYSWLRHVKDCQIVQTNWKVSPNWELHHADELQALMDATDKYFGEKYQYNIYRQNSSLSQLLRQGECDVLGLSISENGAADVYAIDVAFHENGLNYGGHNETCERIIKKCIRTAMCVYGYLNISKATIIFASPKINPAEKDLLKTLANEAELILKQHGLDYIVRIIANEDFGTDVIAPIIKVSNDVSDTAELFLRSYQLYKMFEPKAPAVRHYNHAEKKRILTNSDHSSSVDVQNIDCAQYKELKIGEIAKIILRQKLEAGCADAAEIASLQTLEYSKGKFGIYFPLLVPVNSSVKEGRYYVKPLIIYGTEYRMCSQWVEKSRPQLITWLTLHDGNKSSDNL